MVDFLPNAYRVLQTGTIHNGLVKANWAQTMNDMNFGIRKMLNTFNFQWYQYEK